MKGEAAGAIQAIPRQRLGGAHERDGHSVVLGPLARQRDCFTIPASLIQTLHGWVVDWRFARAGGVVDSGPILGILEENPF